MSESRQRSRDGRGKGERESDRRTGRGELQETKTGGKRQGDKYRERQGQKYHYEEYVLTQSFSLEFRQTEKHNMRGA